MRNFTLAAAVLAATATVLVAGCSVDGTPAAKSGPATIEDPRVDTAQLQTGDYQTTPSAPFGTATTKDILDVESQRMAEFVVLPLEVDRDLVSPKLPTTGIRSHKNLAVVLNDAASNAPANQNNLLVGFVGTASSPVAPSEQRSMNQMVLRYTDPAAAKAAAQQMYDALLSDNKYSKHAKADLPGVPGALAMTSHTDSDRKTALMAFLPHNDYVIFTWYGAPDAQQSRLAPAVKSAFDQQVPLIDKFPKTPTKAQNGGTPVKVEIDQNDILVYAIPNKKGQDFAGNDRAVYGPRGLAFFSTDPTVTVNTLSQNGSEHNAEWATTVYRASTPAGAQKIVDAFYASQQARGWTPHDAPPGLPIAKCLQSADDGKPLLYCIFKLGRYIGEASTVSPEDPEPQTTFQRISAQYLILTKADQNAN